MTVQHMNIDVKNAFDKVILLCEETRKLENEEVSRDLFLSDIDNFISYISSARAAERFAFFVKVYACEIGRKYIFSGKGERKLPEILKGFRQSGSHICILKFFTVVSQYYMSSGFDRRDIDFSKVTEYLTDIKNYISDYWKVQPESAEGVQKPSAPGSRNDSQQGAEETKASGAKQKKSRDFDDKSSLKEATIQNDGESREPEPTVEELLEELNSLIGLNGVKQEVNQIINLISVNKKASEFGIRQAPMSLHLVFFGNPGTGKTTVARILAKIYKALGVLSEGQLIEADRSRLVGGYVGQTAIKTQEVIDSAMGGILFIDEAYTLTHDKGGNDFGQEAVDTILKAMEDHRDDFIVIVAGYPGLMKEFVESNPGLKSRFNQYINFEDYKPQELLDIFKLYCKPQRLTLDEDCERFLTEYFTDLYNNRKFDYANGRDVRNFFEKTIRTRANRINPILKDISEADFFRIDVEDLKNASKQMLSI